ncbi:hypothetical protein THOM_0662 [Trachipleistophora hominis]|uniref:EF-hand domain-containing protein n=1 Tax=Trachipleistophora hominis TaxID=72359 RepID=L7JYG3_TRAHO|nr:hypothetical protein THOM_0662 [Trachipleistophora hominis]
MQFGVLLLAVLISATDELFQWMKIEENLPYNSRDDSYESDGNGYVSKDDFLEPKYKFFERKHELDENFKKLCKPDIMYMLKEGEKAMICDFLEAEVIRSKVDGELDVNASECLLSFFEDVSSNLTKGIVDYKIFVYIFKRVNHNLGKFTNVRMLELPADIQLQSYSPAELKENIENVISQSIDVRNTFLEVLREMLGEVEKVLFCRTGRKITHTSGLYIGMMMKTKRKRMLLLCGLRVSKKRLKSSSVNMSQIRP